MPLLLYLHLMLLAGSPIVAIDLRLLLNFKGANLFANRCKRTASRFVSLYTPFLPGHTHYVIVKVLERLLLSL